MDITEITKLTNKRLAEPWIIMTKPFHVVGNIYFVGTSWVSCFLIETEEGLILIDCAMQETAYQLIDAIHQVGLNPGNIKKLFISHGHFDHCGAARIIQEMTGCEIWLGKDDEFFFTERRDLIHFEHTVPDFKITNTYDYDSEFNFGGTIIKPFHCPGHTPGTTSFFIETQNEGKNLTCAMHGGLGINGISKPELIENRLPVSLHDDYRRQLEEMMEKHVDIVLPSHVGHAVDYDFLGLGYDTSRGSEKFIDTNAWSRMLSSKLKQFEENCC